MLSEKGTSTKNNVAAVKVVGMDRKQGYILLLDLRRETIF